MRTVTKYALLIWAFLGLNFLATAQQDSSYHYFSLEHNYGGILKHSAELPEIDSKRIQGFTFLAAKLHTSKTRWKQCYCFPIIGAGLSVYDFDSPKVLGHSINSFLFVAPYLNPFGKLRFIPKGAAGFSYVSKIYDEKTNPENNFFSTHYSFFLQLHLSLRYEITKNITASSGVSYNHISNGGTKQPNKGMNFLTFNTGVSYYLRSPQIPSYKTSKSNLKNQKKWRYTGSCFFSLKVAKATETEPQKNCAIVGCNLAAGYFIPRFSIVRLGAEYIADTYIRTVLNRSDINKDYQRVALLAGHKFKFGKLGFTTDLGIYIYSPYKAIDPVYQHYRLTYQFAQHWNAGVGIKAHRHIASLMMINAGFIF